jgi:hypothetical protein
MSKLLFFKGWPIKIKKTDLLFVLSFILSVYTSGQFLAPDPLHNGSLPESARKGSAHLEAEDTLPSLIADLGTSEKENGRIKLTLVNRNKDSERGIQIFLFDNFKAQMISQKFPADLRVGNFDLDYIIGEECYQMINIAEIKLGESKTVYSSNLPSELKEGFFDVTVKKGKHQYTRIVKYLQANKTGVWNLMDKATF